MSPDSTPYSISASIKDYLLRLQESGVDGFFLDAAGKTADVVVPPLEVKHQAGKTFENVEQGRLPESLEKIRKDLGNCQLCQLGSSRKNLVFGVGNPHARILFVGDWPAVVDDQKGEPFAGEEGQVLNRIVTAMGLKREEVYICNVVKCCPPESRDPQKEEINACSPFLLRQIQSVKPEVIVALGKFSANMLLNLKEPISRLRGKFHDCQGVPLMPTYHPSYLLGNKGDSGLFWDVWDDMVQVLQLLKLPVPEKNRKR